MLAEQESTAAVAICPSFSIYADLSLSTAARVSREELSSRRGSDSEFEFFPQFSDSNSSEPQIVKLDSAAPADSLRKLFISDGSRRGADDAPSSSGSESEFEFDEVDIPAGLNHCIWKPNSSPARSPSPGCCKKSNSTGSSSSSSKSKKWRIRDLLRRSSSDGGKDSYILLSPSSPVIDSRKSKQEKSGSSPKPKERSKEKVSPHEAFYVKSKALKEGGKRRSFLPYRQDLVGLFSSASIGRNFP